MPAYPIDPIQIAPPISPPYIFHIGMRNRTNTQNNHVWTTGQSGQSKPGSRLPISGPKQYENEQVGRLMSDRGPVPETKVPVIAA